MDRSDVSRRMQGPNNLFSKNVSVSLKSVIPMLVQAVEQRKSWVCDFADEEISLPRDLFEVIQAAMLYGASSDENTRKTTEMFLASAVANSPE